MTMPSVPRPARVRPALLAATLAAVVSLVGLPGPPAHAHAGLVSSDPPAGARLERAPAEVRLDFSEELGAPAYVVVSGPQGRVETGRPRVEGRVVHQRVRAEASGAYTIAFRVVSVDGHPVTGEIAFEVVGDRASDPAATSPPRAEPPSAASSPPVAAAGRASAPDPARGWWDRHSGHALLVGALLGAGLLLLLASRRRVP